METRAKVYRNSFKDCLPTSLCRGDALLKLATSREVLDGRTPRVSNNTMSKSYAEYSLMQSRKVLSMSDCNVLLSEIFTKDNLSATLDAKSADLNRQTLTST